MSRKSRKHVDTTSLPRRRDWRIKGNRILTVWSKYSCRFSEGIVARWIQMPKGMPHARNGA